MSDFFKYMETISPAITHISAMCVSGPHTGEKGLFANGRWVFTTGTPQIFAMLSPELYHFSGPKLITAGSDTFFCETVTDAPELIICGAGHVSMPVIRLGRMTGFHVTVIDDRADFCHNAQSNGADKVLCRPFEEALDNLTPKKSRYFVVVTRGHEYDIACLKQILSSDFTYVGMMGSRTRTVKVKEALISAGISPALADAVHMPIGLPIKAETPEEIALSIMSEIILEKNSRHPSYSYTKAMLQALKDGHCALVTILSRKGSSPRSAGTKMVVLADGQCIGTVGGGIAEARITKLASECIKNHTTAGYTVDMSGKEAAEDGMVCGGHIEVFIEAV